VDVLSLVVSSSLGPERGSVSQCAELHSASALF
jgi:hypothetical protein